MMRICSTFSMNSDNKNTLTISIRPELNLNDIFQFVNTMKRSRFVCSTKISWMAFFRVNLEKIINIINLLLLLFNWIWEVLSLSFACHAFQTIVVRIYCGCVFCVMRAVLIWNVTIFRYYFVCMYDLVIRVLYIMSMSMMAWMKFESLNWKNSFLLFLI